MHYPPFSNQSILQNHFLDQNHGKAQKPPIQYLPPHHQITLLQFTSRTLFDKFMKFRKWSFGERFVQVCNEILKLSNSQLERFPKKLKGQVQVPASWALFNWIMEFQNIMYVAKMDQNHRNGSHLASKSIQNASLEMDIDLIDKIQRIKKSKDMLSKFNSCLSFLIDNLSSLEFFAVQFLIKVIKINQFFKSMKNFSSMVSTFESQFDFFGKKTSKSNLYADAFLKNNLPQLQKVQEEINQIIMAYQIERSSQENKTKMYQLEICIKLIKNDIYKGDALLDEKQENFEFVAKHSMIEQILNRVTNRQINQNHITKGTVSVSELIRQNDKLTDDAIDILQTKHSDVMVHHSSELQISSCLHSISSDNSNSLIEEETKKVQHTYEPLSFSKSFQFSNSEKDIEQAELPKFLKNQNEQTNIFKILDDEKTIPHNFNDMHDQKKSKKIKKNAKSSKVYGFECRNGKVFVNQDQCSNANEVYKLKNKFKDQRFKKNEKRHNKKQNEKNEAVDQVNKGTRQVTQQKKILEESHDNSRQDIKIIKQNQHDSTFDCKSSSLIFSSLQQKNPQMEKRLYMTPIKNKFNYDYVQSPSIDDQEDQQNLNSNNKCQQKNSLKPIIEQSHEKHNHLERAKIDSNNKNLQQSLQKNQKTINFKESYKLANSRFAPLSKSSVNNNRFNPKMSFIRRSKSSVKNARTSLHTNLVQMTYLKRIHEPRFEHRISNSFDDDEEYLVDETPPKYKKNKNSQE